MIEQNQTLIDCLLTSTGIIGDCKTYINSLGIIIFSDYRLIKNFKEACATEITKLNCGRLAEPKPLNVSKNEIVFHEQGKTIECLSSNLTKLNQPCMTQMNRITELQSTDYHLDRKFYFACREDRERFCKNVISGNGMLIFIELKNLKKLSAFLDKFDAGKK